MKYLKHLPALLVLFTLSSCWDNEDKKVKPPKDTVIVAPKDTTGLKDKDLNKNKNVEEEQVKLGISAAEEKKIMPALGLTFTELQKNLPEIKNTRPENNNEKLGSQGFTQSNARIVMLNKTIEAEFHFKNDSLVKCSYVVSELDYNQADRFYKGLQNFYSSKLGECKETMVEEENHYNRSCNWIMNGSKAELSYDINKSVITWGLEKK
ncbi:MAG: hypothetical protein ACJ75J_11990 [Cytophagaceae bacterium]